MFLGHYGLALAAKSAMKDSSLGTAVMLGNLADELWPILLCLGVEHVDVRAAPPNLQFVFVSYPWSHGLLSLAVIGALVGAVLAWRKRRRATVLIGAGLVVSHWFLDLPFHLPDLPLWPGGPRVGLGLWHSVPVTLLCEALLFVGGVVIYMRSTRAKDRVGSVALWAMVLTLLAICASIYAGSEPMRPEAVGPSGLALWLFVPWSYWIHRHRADRSEN